MSKDTPERAKAKEVSHAVRTLNNVLKSVGYEQRIELRLDITRGAVDAAFVREGNELPDKLLRPAPTPQWSCTVTTWPMDA